MFTDIDGHQVIRPNGRWDYVDTTLLATGRRPDVGHLAALGALPDGTQQRLRGLSSTCAGLGYVGLEWQRSLASATLRAVGRNADYLVRRLLRQQRATADSSCCCLPA